MGHSSSALCSLCEQREARRSLLAWQALARQDTNPQLGPTLLANLEVSGEAHSH